MDRKKAIYFLFGCALAAAALWVCFRNVSAAELRSALAGVRAAWLLPNLVLFLLFYAARAARWSVFCRPVKAVPARRLFGPLMLGHLASILPLHAGNWVRAVLLTAREGMRFSASLATVVLETLLDVLALAVLVCAALILFPQVLSGEARIAAVLHTAGVSLAVTLAVLVVLCFLLVLAREPVLKVLLFPVRRVSRRAAPPVERALRSFVQGLDILRRPADLALSLALTAASVCFFVFSAAPLYAAFGLSGLPPASLLLLFVSVYLCVIVLPTPAYLGAFQMGVVLVLEDLYGVPPARAAVFAMAYWACYIGAIVLFAAFFLVRDHVTLRALLGRAGGVAVTRAGRESAETIQVGTEPERRQSTTPLPVAKRQGKPIDC